MRVRMIQPTFVTHLPEYPTLFAKFADALIGAHDHIVRPEETDEFDWEAELAIIIGSPVRRARGAPAGQAIAGFTVLNDITCRDRQFPTREWLQGKIWDSSTPVGPYLVTPDELPGGVRPVLGLQLLVDGELMQADSTADLLFDPVALVEYVSTIGRASRSASSSAARRWSRRSRAWAASRTGSLACRRTDGLAAPLRRRARGGDEQPQRRAVAGICGDRPRPDGRTRWKPRSPRSSASPGCGASSPGNSPETSRRTCGLPGQQTPGAAPRWKRRSSASTS